MNKNEKRWIILLIAVVIIATILLVVLLINKDNNNEEEKDQQIINEEKYVTELEDGTKLNTSEELRSKKTYGNLSISNVQYTEKDDVSVLLADVTNNGKTTHEVEIVKITIYGENEEIITVIEPVIGKIEPGETIKLNAAILADVANAKDFKIEAAD